MKCSKCEGSDTITLSGRPYCSDCGSAVEESAPQAKTDAAKRPKHPIAPVRAPVKPSPRLAAASGGVLDLRGVAPKRKPKGPRRTDAVIVPDPPRRKTPLRAEQPAPKAVTPPRRNLRAAADSARLAAAASVPKSGAISKFAAKILPPAPAPAPDPAAPRQPSRELPPAVAAQHRRLGALPSRPRPQISEPQALSPRRAAALTAAALVLMGSYIWSVNYPKLELRQAARTAGFAASMPTYMPSSYSVRNNVDASPGKVTLQFHSPSFREPIQITQRPTAWDSKSLLENFVAAQTRNYSKVDGQGLTIYLTDKGSAAWINHGVWYTIEGASRLSKDQILKIAYGL